MPSDTAVMSPCIQDGPKTRIVHITIQSATLSGRFEAAVVRVTDPDPDPGRTLDTKTNRDFHKRPRILFRLFTPRSRDHTLHADFRTTY